MDISSLKNKKVLVIDDFANVRRSIKGQLQGLGLQNVHEASDGDSSSRMVKESKFDLILCDYNLGKGRDGARLLEEWRTLKLLQQSAVFVLITAETSRDMVVSAMEFLPDDYLAKPFTMEVLSNRLERWFEQRNILLPILISEDKKDWRAVSVAARDVIEQHPRYRATAQKYYVEALLQLGELTKAEHFLKGLLAKRFISWAQVSIHRIELMQKKFSAAEVGLRTVLNKDPNYIPAYDYLVQTLIEMNKEEDVQIWLERAIQRAPKNISRQHQLAEVAQQNLDFNRASHALKDITNMSVNTMHEHVGMYQEYIRNLQMEEDRTENESRKREIAREIVSISRKMSSRFAGDKNSRLFNKALSLQKNNDFTSASAQSDLDELFLTTSEIVDDIVSETALFVCEILYQGGRDLQADELVNKFKKHFSNEPNVVRRFNELQAEPVSFEARKQAKILNLKGIEQYKNKQYTEAIPQFRKALEHSPRHPGIILNYVQSMLLRMKDEGIVKTDVEICVDCMQRLQYLPEDHNQYERYKKLKSNLKKVK